MTQTYFFSVQAEACPAALPRVLDVFALYGSVPDQCYTQRAGSAGEELVIEVQMSDIDADAADRIARRLHRVVSVQGVLWSAKSSHA
jgi:hypothetical protein